MKIEFSSQRREMLLFLTTNKQYSWYVKYKSYLQERILKFELITLNETSRVEARKFFFILCLQPRDKAAMFGVNTIEFFLEQFT